MKLYDAWQVDIQERSSRPCSARKTQQQCGKKRGQASLAVTGCVHSSSQLLIGLSNVNSHSWSGVVWSADMSQRRPTAACPPRNDERPVCPSVAKDPACSWQSQAHPENDARERSTWAEDRRRSGRKHLRERWQGLRLFDTEGVNS